MRIYKRFDVKKNKNGGVLFSFTSTVSDALVEVRLVVTSIMKIIWHFQVTQNPKK